MITESEIGKGMVEFLQRAINSAPEIPFPKPFIATITESKTDSTPFPSLVEVPPLVEESPATGAPPQPTITDLQPNKGPIKGGQAITVSGTNFISGAKVFVGDVLATQIVFVNDKKITAVTPAHAQGNVAIKVENIPNNPDFSYEITLAYLYIAPPTITAVTPVSGPTGGGTAVTISGLNLEYTANVNWGGANIPFSYDGISVLHVTAPAHSAGFINILLTNTFGDTGGAANAYQYSSPPDHYDWSTLIGHTPTDTGFDNGAVKRFGITAKTSGGVSITDYQGYVNVSSIFLGTDVSFNDNPNIDYPIQVVNGTALFDVQAFCINHGASTVQSLQFHAKDAQYPAVGDSPLYGISNLPDLTVGGRRHGLGGGSGGVGNIGWVMGYADAFGAVGRIVFGPWNWEGVTLNNREVKIQMRNPGGFVIDYNGPGTLEHVLVTVPTSFNGFGVNNSPTVNFIHGEATTTVSATYRGENPSGQSYAYFYLKATANGVTGQSPQCSILNHL